MTAYEQVFAAAQSPEVGDMIFGLCIAAVVLGVIILLWSDAAKTFTSNNADEVSEPNIANSPRDLDEGYSKDKSGAVTAAPDLLKGTPL